MVGIGSPESMVAVPTGEMEELCRVKDEIAAMPMYSCLCIDPHLTDGEISDQVLIFPRL